MHLAALITAWILDMIWFSLKQLTSNRTERPLEDSEFQIKNIVCDSISDTHLKHNQYGMGCLENIKYHSVYRNIVQKIIIYETFYQNLLTQICFSADWDRFYVLHSV